MKNGEQYTLRFLFAKENPIIAPWLQDFSVLLAASDDGINMNRMSEMTWQKSKIKTEKRRSRLRLVKTPAAVLVRRE